MKLCSDPTSKRMDLIALLGRLEFICDDYRKLLELIKSKIVKLTSSEYVAFMYCTQIGSVAAPIKVNVHKWSKVLLNIVRILLR
jgi:hypothetical protein